MRSPRLRTFVVLSLLPVLGVCGFALAATLSENFANSLSPHQEGGAFPYFFLLLFLCVSWTPAMLITALVVFRRARRRAAAGHGQAA